MERKFKEKENPPPAPAEVTQIPPSGGPATGHQRTIPEKAHEPVAIRETSRVRRLQDSLASTDRLVDNYSHSQRPYSKTDTAFGENS